MISDSQAGISLLSFAGVCNNISCNGLVISFKPR